MRAHPSPTGLPPRVLLIEGCEDVRRVLLEILTNEGYDVHGVSDGAEGIEQCTHMPYDIVIADLEAREDAGFETIRLLHERFPRTPILAVSASDSPSLRTRAAESGAHQVFAKPFDIAGFLKAVRRSVPGERASGQ